MQYKFHTPVLITHDNSDFVYTYSIANPRVKKEIFKQIYRKVIIIKLLMKRKEESDEEKRGGNGILFVIRKNFKEEIAFKYSFYKTIKDIQLL